MKVNGIVSMDDTSAVLDTSYYDTVKVKVERGAVTISASGDGSYYIGDEIKLTGTNTASDRIYLFITGLDLPENGIVLSSLPALTAARYGADQYVSVETDNTWDYKWDTVGMGKYYQSPRPYFITCTIYATSRLTNGTSAEADEETSAVSLSNSEYATSPST